MKKIKNSKKINVTEQKKLNFDAIKEKKHLFTWAIPFVILFCVGSYFLKEDFKTLIKFYMAALFLGSIAFPLNHKLFHGFKDAGWMFSKVLGIAIAGFITWFLACINLVPFNTIAVFAICFLLTIISLFYYYVSGKQYNETLTDDRIVLIIVEEFMFFAVFLLWAYLNCFKPEAHGVEKYMDYGFMQTIMRTTTFPSVDLWYSDGLINYYYGGQYFAVFLTKLTASEVKITYNLMRNFISAFAFVLPFSLVFQMTMDHFANLEDVKFKEIKSGISGFIAGLSVTFAGNMQYVIYKFIIPFICKLKGEEAPGYYFPNATRFIGHNPETNDKCTHEFPCYSFVLGDLHAHVVNVFFVLLFIGLMYAWIRKARKDGQCQDEKIGSIKQYLYNPYVIITGIMLGMFNFTNYWDFIIYFVVFLGTMLINNIYSYKISIKKMLIVCIAEIVEVAAIEHLVILPFTVNFIPMMSGIGIAKNHSAFYQLAILWALPVCLVLIYYIFSFLEYRKVISKISLYEMLEKVEKNDIYALFIGLCAIGLIIIPELIYVRDIYEENYARNNTMFKLTFQAFMMFAIVMGYSIFRMIYAARKAFKVLAVTGLIVLLTTVMYFGESVNAWYGNVFDLSRFKGLDAQAFIATDYTEDAGCINALNTYVEDLPVVLETYGDSYSDYCRVSAMTGLPTVEGWYVHEWLWRGNDDLMEKRGEIDTIYTSDDTEKVKELVTKYNISYIFVGKMERERYGDQIKHDNLKALGYVYLDDPIYDTYVVKVQ